MMKNFEINGRAEVFFDWKIKIYATQDKQQIVINFEHPQAVLDISMCEELIHNLNLALSDAKKARDVDEEI